MSHKEAKRERKEAAQQQKFLIEIHSTGPGDVRCTFPMNAKLALYMMSEALKIMARYMEFTQAEQPAIVQPPPGFRIPRGT